MGLQCRAQDMMQDAGCRIGMWGAGQSMGHGVWDQDAGCGVQDTGCRVQDQLMGCRIRIQMGTDLTQDRHMPMAVQMSRGMSPFCSPSVIWSWYFFTSHWHSLPTARPSIRQPFCSAASTAA